MFMTLLSILGELMLNVHCIRTVSIVYYSMTVVMLDLAHYTAHSDDGALRRPGRN